MFKKDLT